MLHLALAPMLLLMGAVPIHVAAAASEAPSDLKVIGRYEGLRVEWTDVSDESTLTNYVATGTPADSSLSPLTCTVLPVATNRCDFGSLAYGDEYSFVVRANYNDASAADTAAATGTAGISMSVEARALGTTDVLATPRIDNDIFVESLIAGSLTGNDFDLWACPDDSIVPRDNGASGGCDGPNIESREGRDTNTFTLSEPRYGRFCNWLIIIHDYSSGGHSNWFGPLLGADGQPLDNCPNALAQAPNPPAPVATPAAPTPAPEPVADPGGGLPVATPPGVSTGSVGGVPTAPTPARPNAGMAEFRVGTVESRLDVAVAGAGRVRGNDAAPVLEVVRDRVAQLTGGGMRPGGIAEVWMLLPDGGSRQVALLPIAADGTFDGALPFTGELDGRGPLPIGERTIQLFGIGADGQLTVINVGIRVEQPSPLAPEPERAPGAPPTLAPGQSLATNAGVPTPVTVTPLPDARSTRIAGDGWLMDIDVPDGTVRDEGGAPLIEIANGTDSRVRGTGFMPGTRAYVWLMSDPTFLGEVSVSADGSFSGDVPIDGVEAGEHTLQLSGVGTDGYVRAANLGVVLIGDGPLVPTRIPAGDGPLGVWTLPVMLLASALGLAGVGVAARRRRAQRGSAGV